jgi:hypothetical protein
MRAPVLHPGKEIKPIVALCDILDTAARY